jgi:hypothetical protein
MFDFALDLALAQGTPSFLHLTVHWRTGTTMPFLHSTFHWRSALMCYFGSQFLVVAQMRTLMRMIRIQPWRSCKKATLRKVL